MGAEVAVIDFNTKRRTKARSIKAVEPSIVRIFTVLTRRIFSEVLESRSFSCMRNNIQMSMEGILENSKIDKKKQD
jgi:hypothetical protein